MYPHPISHPKKPGEEVGVEGRYYTGPELTARYYLRNTQRRDRALEIPSDNGWRGWRIPGLGRPNWRRETGGGIRPWRLIRICLIDRRSDTTMDLHRMYPTGRIGPALYARIGHGRCGQGRKTYSARSPQLVEKSWDRSRPMDATSRRFQQQRRIADVCLRSQRRW